MLALHNEQKVRIRRTQVASLLSKSFNETEIAQALGVHQGTISRDLKVLKAESQKFIYELAKSDLAYYFKSCINGIEESKKECWKLYFNRDTSTRDKLLALKIIITADVERFRLLESGPGVLAMKSLDDRVNKIEEGNRQQVNR